MQKSTVSLLLQYHLILTQSTLTYLNIYVIFHLFAYNTTWGMRILLGSHDLFLPFELNDQLSGVHSLGYRAHNGTDFPIGFISGGPISADDARVVVEATYENCEPIIHLALAPHPSHDTVRVLPRLGPTNITVVADAVIVPKTGPSSIATFVGDCAVIVAASADWIGFIHCGTPELFDGLLDQFASKWPDNMNQTHIFMGPCISGVWYEYDPEKVPPRYKSFIIGPNETDNAFDCYTFGVNLAIERELQSWQPASFENCRIDPFVENIQGNNRWASHRFARHNQFANHQGNGLSPRDCAMFTYVPRVD